MHLMLFFSPPPRLKLLKKRLFLFKKPVKQNLFATTKEQAVGKPGEVQERPHPLRLSFVSDGFAGGRLLFFGKAKSFRDRCFHI